METTDKFKRLQIGAGRGQAMPKSALKRSSCNGLGSISAESEAITSGRIETKAKKFVAFPDHLLSPDDEGDEYCPDFQEMSASADGYRLQTNAQSPFHGSRPPAIDSYSSSPLRYVRLSFDNDESFLQLQRRHSALLEKSAGQFVNQRTNGNNRPQERGMPLTRSSAAAHMVDYCDDITTRSSPLSDIDNNLQAVTNSTTLTLSDDNLQSSVNAALTDEEVRQVELFYHGLKSQVFVCTCLAELYLPVTLLTEDALAQQTTLAPLPTAGGGIGGGVKRALDELRFVVTGIPLWLGNDIEQQRDQRCHQQSDPLNNVSIILAERGTGFTLWKHSILSESSYRRVDVTFHVVHLGATSSSQPQHHTFAGLNFMEATASTHFLDAFKMFISQAGTLRGRTPASDRLKKKSSLPKSSISSPCLFTHVTNVDKMRWRRSDQSMCMTTKFAPEQEHGGGRGGKDEKKHVKQHKRSSSHQGEIIMRSKMNLKRSNSVDRSRKF